MISQNLLPGLFFEAIRVTNFMKSLGPCEWVVDVGAVVVVVLVVVFLCLLVLVLVAFERPK